MGTPLLLWSGHWFYFFSNLVVYFTNWQQCSSIDYLLFLSVVKHRHVWKLCARKVNILLWFWIVIKKKLIKGMSLFYYISIVYLLTYKWKWNLRWNTWIKKNSGNLCWKCIQREQWAFWCEGGLGIPNAPFDMLSIGGFLKIQINCCN